MTDNPPVACDSMRSAEIKEGITVFAEKRPPKF
jgi:hypothetical protein